jgi:hypoxanthine phosphoribosyltransferase
VNRPSEVLLSAEDAAACVTRLAEAIAPRIDDDWIVVCLLTGGLWFATDLTRALSRLGRNPLFDALWLSSYGDETASSGAVFVRADLQRPVAGRKVLIVDDVLDSGLSLREALRRLAAAGPAEVLTAVFARKPWPTPREIDPDFVAWEAPARFLAGYGMDVAGRYRGLPEIVAFD